MLGISGAALATGIGQCVTLSVYLIIYCTHRFPVQLRLSCIKPDWRLDAKLYSIGVPAILNLALPSVLVSFLNSLLAAYSQGYVVILGIYYKLQTFLYLPAGGIVQGMRPLISYNYGAGEHGRVKKIYNLAMGMNAAIMAAGTIICLVGSPALIGMFTTNADTIAAGQVALRIISAGFLVSTLSVTASGSLEALGKGTQSLIISLCRYIIIMIPAAWILCRTFGPVGVWHRFLGHRASQCPRRRSRLQAHRQTQRLTLSYPARPRAGLFYLPLAPPHSTPNSYFLTPNCFPS